MIDAHSLGVSDLFIEKVYKKKSEKDYTGSSTMYSLQSVCFVQAAEIGNSNNQSPEPAETSRVRLLHGTQSRTDNIDFNNLSGRLQSLDKK